MFEKYKDTLDGFDKFNNSVFNMPRDEFENLNLYKIRYLSAYLLLVENDLGYKKEISYKEILISLQKAINEGKESLIKDKTFEKLYLNFNDINEHYTDMGRQFRHLMGQCKLFKIIKMASKVKVTIDFDRCRELVLSENEILTSVIRNNILEINVKDNPFLRSLRSVKEAVVNKDIVVDYPIAQTIIEYINDIKRPATKLEIAFLLGRIDDMHSKDEILDFALSIGKILPRTFEEQKDYFFNIMNWYKKDGNGKRVEKFPYRSSAEPWFKFRTFILWMINFGLLSEDKEGMLSLTYHSLNIIKSELNPYLVDLEQLLEKLEKDNIKDSEISNAVVKSRQEELNQFLLENNKLIELISKRSLTKQNYEMSGKLKRNPLVMLFSKVIKNYECDIIYSVDKEGMPHFDFNKTLFENVDGMGYCEGHHIIEFSREDGPDIVENIILLDPNTHMLIHHGHPSLKRDLYSIMRQKGIVTVETFSNMIDKYNCLNEEHINILYNKGLIYFDEKPKLIKKIKSKL